MKLFTIALTLLTALIGLSTLKSGVVEAAPAATLELNVPFYRQERRLSCEIASLVSALRYKGVEINESDLLAKLVFDTTPKANGVWGNPNYGFVGSIDGQMPSTGYGVYWDPIAILGSEYRPTEGIHQSNIVKIVDALHNNEVPIIWGYSGSGRMIRWKDDKDRTVNAVLHEHTFVVTGYSGPRERPTGFFLLDPILGKTYKSRSAFLTNWSKLQNSGVIVK